MDIRAVQYERVQERDEKINHQCVLCACGFPRGSGYGNEHHEIISKAKLRGKHNLAKLYELSNIAMACQFHHHHFQFHPIVWMKAMVYLGLANESDYRNDPNWVDRYPPFNCMGDFGYGTKFFDGNVPSAITMPLTGSGNQTGEFCGLVCPVAKRCLDLSREKYKSKTA